MTEDENLAAVLHYHDRTKHHYSRNAASLGYMDWETQPNPFRRYEGAPLIRFPLPEDDKTTSYESIFQANALPTRALSRSSLSELFYYSLALSAWKQFGTNRWALRVNPSSGNLHPTEAYLAVNGLDGLNLKPGVYHYAPHEHGMEMRAELTEETWLRLTAGLPPNAFLVGLSSIHWRESWKYGERAYRYCQHDVGHALAALRLAAARLGWKLRVLDHVADEQISSLFGLDRIEEFVVQEKDVPNLLVAAFPGGQIFDRQTNDCLLPDEAVRAVAQGKWLGKANRLSRDHHDWEIIDVVTRACRKEKLKTLPSVHSTEGGPPRADSIRTPPLFAGQIIRQRRSALAMDGATPISKEVFYAMVSRILPHRDSIPWDSCGWPPLVHLALFVHRVTGLEPGLYMLVRDAAKLEWLKAQTDPSFLWKKPPDAPAHLPLYSLKEGDLRGLASQISCTQEIAGDGAFSLGMLAEFKPVLSRYGAHFYRNIFWETGMIGQVLYLDAEAFGVRATGIGCFFDDAVHEALGIRGHELQSLYHFTVGRPVSDERLMTLPAYSHLGSEPAAGAQV
jgi:SagB-type dehydrogenase family enzyme